MRKSRSARLAVWVLSLWLPWAGSAGEFSKPTNTVGDANCFGELQFTSHLGAIELSRDEVYDFYYQYSSHPGHDSVHFGKGFFVPLLEASLIDHDYFLELTTMGGATIYVYRLPEDPDKYTSLNGQNIVYKLGDDSYRRENEEGFRFHYRLGKLTQMETPKGTRIEFTYEDDFCREVRSSTGAVVCSLAKLSANHSVFTTARGRYELTFQNHPASNDEEYLSAGLPPLPTLAKVGWPDGNETTFVYPETKGSDAMVMQMAYGGQMMEAVWERHSGRLVRCDGVDYEISALSRQVDYEAERTRTGVYSIRRSFPDGSWKEFLHDEDAGFSDDSDSEGEKIRTHYINTRGKVFNFVRRKERLFADKPPETFYEAFYDTDGNLIREVNAGVVTWYLREGGIPESAVREGDDFVRLDGDGKVTHSRRGEESRRIRWFADGSSRIVSEYSWGEMALRYLDPNGNSIPFPADEKFEERNSE